MTTESCGRPILRSTKTFSTQSRSLDSKILTNPSQSVSTHTLGRNLQSLFRPRCWRSQVATPNPRRRPDPIEHHLLAKWKRRWGMWCFCRIWATGTTDKQVASFIYIQPAHQHLELADVTIRIPVPSGVGAPIISNIDGDYKHDSRKNFLEWTLPVIGLK